MVIGIPRSSVEAESHGRGPEARPAPAPSDPLNSASTLPVRPPGYRNIDEFGCHVKRMENKRIWSCLDWCSSLHLVMQILVLEPTKSVGEKAIHAPLTRADFRLKSESMHILPCNHVAGLCDPQTSKPDCSLRTPRSFRMGFELARQTQALLASLAPGTTRHCIAMSYSAASLQSSPRQWPHRCMSPRQSHAGRTRWPRLPSTAKETE